MTKLNIEIIATDDEPFGLLTKLAKAKFRANNVYTLSGTETLAIDDGMNDIRALINANVIEFYYRYDKDRNQYESLILDFCRQNNLTLRFCNTEKK
ncbi:hypothetical protein [Aliiglaciecola lipolytica]|uniref:hypothetical protein n=1 Tax=Aliiglaciecola lipolytica TaxID=477689 RepID=UPI001C09D5B6|nr:hypothetical protein [Aliiglaciecola lipolytica]MBU2877070.1 hypothetical protein [Aliiglaciecola lipolytica]